MMQDFERTQELVDISATSYGATLAQQAEYMGGMEAALNNLTVSWEAFITGLVDADGVIGIIDFLAGAIQFIGNTVVEILNNGWLLYPLLAMFVVWGISTLANKTQELILNKQILQAQRELQISKNKQRIEEIKIEQTQRVAKKELEIANKKALIAEKKITLEKVKQNREDSLAATDKKNEDLRAKLSQESAQEVLLKSEISQLEGEIITAETELTSLKASNGVLDRDNLEIKQLELENQQAIVQSYGVFSAILQTINGLKLIGNVLSSIFNKKKKEEIAANNTILAQEKAETAELTKQVGLETQKAGVKTAGKAPWIVGLALLGLFAGIAIAGAIAGNSAKEEQSATEETAEAVKKLQVEIYNLAKAEETVKSLGDEFETLSSKIYKSAEDLERLDEIAQQINDEAGEDIVTATGERGLQQIREYQAKLERQKNDKIEEQGDVLSDGIKKQIVDEGSSHEDAISSLMGETANQAAVEQLVLKNTNIGEIEDANLQDSIIQSIIDNADQFFTLDKTGNFTLDYSAIEELFSADKMENLSAAMSSGSLEEIESALKGMDQAAVDFLASSNSIVELFKEGGKLDGSGKVLDKLGIELETLNSLQEQLGEEGFENWLSALDEVENMNYSDAELKKALLDDYSNTYATRQRELHDQVTNFTEEEFQTKIDTGAKLNEYETAWQAQQTAQQLYDNAVIAYEAKKAVIEADDKLDADEKEEALKDYAKEKGIDQLKIDLENATAEVKKLEEIAETPIDVSGIMTLVEAMYNLKTATSLSDEITQLTSKAEKLSEAFDWANLSIKEQNELLTEYPELAQYTADGVITVDEKMKILGKDVNDTADEIKESMTGYKESVAKIIEQGDFDTTEFVLESGMKIDLSKMFEDSEDGTILRSQIASLSEEDRKSFLIKLAASAGIDWDSASVTEKGSFESAVNQIIGAAENYNLQENALANLSVESLINAESMEQLKEAQNMYKKYSNYAEQYKEDLEYLAEDSTEYNNKLLDYQKALTGAITEGSKEIDSIKAKIDNTLGKELSTGVKLTDVVQNVNGVMTLNQEAYDKLTDEEKLYVRSSLGMIEDYYEEWNELEEDQLSNYEELVQSYIDAENKLTQSKIDELEKRKEAYEEYFDELDALEEEEDLEQDRESLIKQIQALSGGADAASKQKIKELQQELNELDKEQLQSQREQMRDALLEDIDNEIETLEGSMDKLDNSIQALISVLNGTAGSETIEQYKDIIVKLIPDKSQREELNLGFKDGGLVDYTGTAQVHGTKTKPEAFLNAKDTSNIQMLLEELELTRSDAITNRTPIKLEENANTPVVIENITIQTNELNNNQDWRNAGQNLAEEFAAEQKKRGINQNVNTRYKW